MRDLLTYPITFTEVEELLEFQSNLYADRVGGNESYILHVIKELLRERFSEDDFSIIKGTGEE